MVIDIKMCRFDAVPWGFRLVGGSDFEFPLTVVKVTEGSIAETAGLRMGDVIVRINDTAASPLTHDEVNNVITHCGNVFFIGVQRENDEEEAPKHFPVSERQMTPESVVSSTCKSPTTGEQTDDFRNVEYMPEFEDRPCSVLSENTEIKLVEEEIAAVLSGESEVLKEHNVLGIFPKPGVCMSSDVLRTLNEEAVKTKAEKDKENKKWTTFLQKPNRPVPKSPAQIEAERRAANAYKVKIQTGARRSVSPAVRPVTPEPVPEKQPSPSPPHEPTPPAAEPEPEVEEPPPTDSEVPNLETVSTVSTDNNGEEQPSETDKIDKEKEASPENKEVAEADNKKAEENATPTEEIIASEEEEIVVDKPIIEKTEEELALEKQLADVQKQLAALSNLPSTIQSTLDAVTKQLAELLPTFKLQQQIQIADPTTTAATQKQANELREISLEKIEEISEDAKHDAAESNEETAAQQRNADDEPIENKNPVDDIRVAEERDKNDLEVESVNLAKKQEAVRERNEMEQEQNLKKQKRHDVIEELEEHLECKNNPRRSKRAFGPLTPSSERPLVLPGGRRWYRPKDAYNDEFIAETLSAQAELITGTTLGVNFMKYQKPEKKIDLDRSEVYKIIHHLDRQPVRGIEIRPPVVPAEVDIRKKVNS